MKKALVWLLLGSMTLTTFVGCGKKDNGATVTDVHELSDEEMEKIMEEYFAQKGATSEVADDEVTGESAEAEADPFAIPETIEGKVPTKNEVYLALEEIGCVNDYRDSRFELKLKEGGENANHLFYGINQLSDDTEGKYVNVNYYTKESAESAKSSLDRVYELVLSRVDEEPDVSKETHYCMEEVEHAMKNSCEVITFKKTLHDKHCNSLTEELIHSHESQYGIENEPAYITEQYIIKGNGYLTLSYVSDSEGNPIREHVQNIIQVFRDLEFITFE